MAALPPRTQPRGAAPPALPPRRRPPPAPCDSENGQSDDEDYLKPNQKDDDDPGEIYDDCSETDEAAPTTDEIYDDCDDDGPDSSHANEEPEGFYDDCNEQPSQPFAPRGLPPPPQTFEDEPQDTYDDLDVGEPVVQQVPKRPGRSQQLPPHPLGAAAESQQKERREPSPPQNPPPGRTWKAIDHSSSRPDFPSRQMSPSRAGQRGLPPVPSPMGGPHQDSLPPIPPITGRNGRSPSPAPRSHYPSTAVDSSPVVVPLKARNRGNFPPPSLCRESDDEETDSESDDFPPPPSPIVHKKSMIGLYAPPPPPSPPPPFMSSAVTPSSNHFGNRINELDNGGEPSSCPAPPPPPPPVSANKGVVVTRVSPKSKPITPNPAPPKPAPGPGGFSLDVNQLKGLRAGLRPVGQDKQAEAKTKSNDNPQESSTVSVSDFRKRFQGEKPAPIVRSNSRPELGTKPPPVSRSFSIGGNQNFPVAHFNNIVNNNNINDESEESPPLPPRPANMPLPSLPSSNSQASEPCARGSSSANCTLSRPGPFSSVVTVGSPAVSPVLPVSVILYNHHGKHTNVSGLPQSSAAKPVTKYEPPQRQETMECDEIYDDASSGDVLDKFDWYHGYLGRKQADARVSSAAKDGAFLVRVSEKDPRYPYTLVVLHNGHVNNLRVRKREDGKMALGDEKVDELAFVDVTALISHHKNHPVLLLGNNHSQVKLQHTPPKG